MGQVVAPSQRRQSRVHRGAVVVMAALQAASLAGVLSFALLLTTGGFVLVGLVVGATLGILMAVSDERARATGGSTIVRILIRGLEGVAVGLLVGILLFGNAQDWHLPVALTAAAGVVVGVVLEAAYRPERARGFARTVTRLVRILYKGGVGAFGGASLLGVITLLSYNPSLIWVNTTGGGALNIVGSVIASIVVSTVVAIIVFALMVALGAIVGAILGLITGSVLEFSAR